MPTIAPARRTVVLLPRGSIVAIVAVTTSAAIHCGEPGSAPPRTNGDAGHAPISEDGGHLTIDAAAETSEAERCEVPVVLPPVVDTGGACAPKPGTDCVPSSWFCLSKWTPFYYDGTAHRQVPPTPRTREPRQYTWTASFTLDRFPVTNRQYAAYLGETGRPALPDVLDDAYGNQLTNESNEPQPTGWLGGKPEQGRLEHPVVGTTRQEAQAYCEHVGGHLPSVAEILRAGQPAAPTTFRFPWGSVFPFNPPASSRIADGFIGPAHASYPLDSPVSAITGDQGPYGTRGLATNVAEWLSTCEEAARTVFVGDAPLVVQRSRFSATCTSAVLTTNFPDPAPDVMGQRIVALVDDEKLTNTYYLGDRLGTTRAPRLEHHRAFTHMPTRPAYGDRAGNHIRNFRIGFRCAYEVP